MHSITQLQEIELHFGYWLVRRSLNNCYFAVRY